MRLAKRENKKREETEQLQRNVTQKMAKRKEKENKKVQANGRTEKKRKQEMN